MHDPTKPDVILLDPPVIHITIEGTGVPRSVKVTVPKSIEDEGLLMLRDKDWDVSAVLPRESIDYIQAPDVDGSEFLSVAQVDVSGRLKCAPDDWHNLTMNTIAFTGLTTLLLVVYLGLRVTNWIRARS